MGAIADGRCAGRIVGGISLGRGQRAFLGLGDDAVLIAIAKVDDQADGQPYDEADLRDCRQHDDQDTAEVP